MFRNALSKPRVTFPFNLYKQLSMSLPGAGYSDLLRALAAGDRTTTERVYRQAYPMVAQWIGTHGGTEDDAADVFQEAMVILFGKAQEADFVLTCAPGTYLYSVARHLWLRRVQHQSRFPAADLREEAGTDDGPDWAYEEDVQEHEQRERQYNRLEYALQQLGDPCASLLRAFYQEGKSMQDISAGSGYSNADTAKTQKYKCLNRLKKLFFQLEAAEH